jgi:GT2 family glycosyltransferase/SAM-dependent methyltransferase
MKNTNKASMFLSMIIPSRKRLDELSRCIDSLFRTAEYPENIEVIIVADSDDPETATYRHPKLNTKIVVVPVGQPMGGLNMAGYRVSCGDYVMLLNDDVLARTSGWDIKIRAVADNFPDGIVLIHTNDKIFEDKLCTFPLVSRVFCDFAGGICPEELIRYRIDDHIYNVFDLLGSLGQRRIIYLPDVVFEHLNREIGISGPDSYKPNEEIHKLDTVLFESMQEERSLLVGKLMGHILCRRTQANDVIWQRRVEILTDWAGLRQPEYVRHMGSEATLSSANTRVTVGVVSANLMSPMAQRCIDSVKRYTTNFDLVVIDNNGSGNFNHSREMNRLIDMCRTDYLVLMDDDVFVEESWLDGLLKCVDDKTALVTPCHKNAKEQFSYAGVILNPDYSGHHTHILEKFDRPMPVQSICSAVMLLDLNKIGHIKVEEVYQKYFLDIAYGLSVWEAGYRVICTPEVVLTHVGGGTLAHNSNSAATKYEQQRTIFVKAWCDTGRLYRLKTTIWESEPVLRTQLILEEEIDWLLKSNLPLEELRAKALVVAEKLNGYPVLIDYANQRIVLRQQSEEAARLAMLLGCFPFRLGDRVVYVYQGKFYGFPSANPAWDINRLKDTDVLSALSVSELSSYFGSYSHFGPEQGKSRLVWLGHIGNHLISISRHKVRSLVRHAARQIAFSTLHAAKKNESIKQLSRVLWIKLDQSSYVKDLRVTMFIRNILRHEGSRIVSRLSKGDYKVPELMAKLTTNGQTIMVDEDYRDFTIFQRDANFFARPRKQANDPDADIFWGLSADEVKAAIEKKDPLELFSNFKGFIILRFEHTYFAIPITEAPFDYDKFVSNKYSVCLNAHSVTQLKMEIDRHQKLALGEQLQTLIFGITDNDELEQLIISARPGEVFTLLVEKPTTKPDGISKIVVAGQSLSMLADAIVAGSKEGATLILKESGFDQVVLPIAVDGAWSHSAIERAATLLANTVEILTKTGQRHALTGENSHRLIYNKHYLTCLFDHLPLPENQTVLEVGCGDGLVCEYMVNLGAKQVVGVDVMQTAGCNFPDTRIKYLCRDAQNLPFPDESFDMVYSIATFEHVSNPQAVFDEIIRLVKVGGYFYIQAGPLYHSPFGHHMFNYFGEYPWIHLRKTPDQIRRYAETTGVADRIKEDMAVSAEDYINSMLSRRHINGLLLDQYDLDTLRTRQDIKEISFSISYEGKDLLTADIIAELSDYDPNWLVQHGFEIAGQRIR